MKYTEIKIVGVKVLEAYKLKVEFNDGKTKIIDVEPILYGDLYGPLRNPQLFGQVTINAEIQIIEWPNGADFHPEILYNWEEYKDELAERAQSWQQPHTI